MPSLIDTLGKASILDTTEGGNVLEEPNFADTFASDPEVVAELREALLSRILSSLLPKQVEFVLDTDHRILGYIGGFGSGKTVALAAKIIALGLVNPGCTIMALEPTYPMIRTVLMPTFEEYFETWGISYVMRLSPQPRYILSLPTGRVEILCQAAEAWQRIRGQNLAAAVWDECDTSPTDIAQKVGEMLLARMRTGEINQLAVASTPEGFRWAYRQFVEADGPDKRLIRVRTRDNPNLPKDFIPSLERNYPPQLIQAYLDGHFVNMASCALYPDFDRSLHYTDDLPRDLDTIYVGVDINVGN